jgi:hypothetical protein
LPIEQVLLDVPEGERVCSVYGTPLEKIGTEFVRRELKFIPARVKVIEYYSVNYGCPNCRKTADLPQIKKGEDGHAYMIHGMASASTVAWIMYQKYFNEMPLYRQECDWKQCGANTPGTDHVLYVAVPQWRGLEASDHHLQVFTYPCRRQCREIPRGVSLISDV